MTSQHLNHAEMVPPTVPPAPPVVPKLHVQRSLSRETITIHFSPLGKEDDDDDDYDDDDDDDEKALYGETSATAAQDDSNVMTALEASEEMVEGMVAEAGTEAAVIPESSTALSPVPNHQSTSSRTSSPPLLLAEKKVSNSNSSPTKSLSLPSMDKPSVSITKSLSTDTEPRESVSPPAPPLVRHRLMKTLVKSLSSDTSQDSSSSTSLPYRLSDSRLNLQLFKQFTQSRMPTVTVASVGDFKTAPPSPLTSPDSRYFFKVSEVEARIEDTKRRLSEVICEPLQMLSKIMDEKSGGVVGGGSICRPKALSSNASELSSLASFSSSNMESNNNTYSIREEEAGEWEFESPKSRASSQAESPGPSWADAKSPSKSLLGSVSLDKCSMSALAKQENEDFCILSSEDFETCSETEANGADTSHNGSGTLTKPPPSSSTEPFSEDEADCEDPASSVPIYTLICLTVLVYGYFLLPLPTYIGGMCLGAVLGFFLTLGVVWLAGPKPSECSFRHSQHHGKPLNLAHLSITEPVLFKGWMNEIVNYDPENYYATLTHSVYVRLEGSILRLSKPNRNIARRATHNEPKPDNIFISQKIYDLTDSKVYLVPPNLAKKRVWNKKYPICVELGKQDDFMSKAEGDRVDEERTAVSGDKGTGTGATQGKGRSSSAYRDVTLYLFGRTGREKEEWFQRILLASKRKSEMKRATSLVGSKNALSSHSRSSSRGSLDEALASPQRLKDSQASSTAVPGIAKAKPLLDYSVYMAALVPTQPAGADPVGSALQSPHSSPEAAKKLPSTHPSLPTGEEEPVAWLNAMLGRVLWDFLGEPHWAELVSNKIQMKLSKIRLPYFMNELTLTELDMGVATPRILGASRPSVDHKGLWFDLDISYSSSFLMTLETKMNLIRLRKEGEAPRTGEPGRDGYRPRTYCLADSDEESSSAGSSDEEDTSETTADSAGAEGHVGGHKPSKMMRFVDKITKSKYFQKATETEFIKKKMEEVSNTPLLLTVEVQELQGTLAVNIPPPPTDRIWYGFRTPPHLELKARPKLGEREVTLAHVTDWIEKKLNQEFQKIFVMPNMDDLWLSVMHSAMDPRSHGGPLACSASGLDASPQAKGAADQQ